MKDAAQQVSQNDQAVMLTDAAADQINRWKQKQGKENLMLRLSVHGGGCSGFKYQLGFDEEKFEDDTVFDHNGAQVVVDEVSLDLLSGTTIDFQESMMGASFVIKNPNAKSGCGCGSSFNT